MLCYACIVFYTHRQCRNLVTVWFQWTIATKKQTIFFPCGSGLVLLVFTFPVCCPQCFLCLSVLVSAFSYSKISCKAVLQVFSPFFNLKRKFLFSIIKVWTTFWSHKSVKENIYECRCWPKIYKLDKKGEPKTIVIKKLTFKEILNTAQN